jgi:hypothetical protein
VLCCARLCCTVLCCIVQVQAAAVDAGTATYKLVGNRDIEHILDDLLHCVARPEEVSAVVTKLSATTFVQVSIAGCSTHTVAVITVNKSLCQFHAYTCHFPHSLHCPQPNRLWRRLLHL